MNYIKISHLIIEIVELKKEIIEHSNKHKLFDTGVVLPDQGLFVPWLVQQFLLNELQKKEKELQNLLKKN